MAERVVFKCGANGKDHSTVYRLIDVHVLARLKETHIIVGDTSLTVMAAEYPAFSAYEGSVPFNIIQGRLVSVIRINKNHVERMLFKYIGSHVGT